MPELVAEFSVHGEAKTAGSKRAFIPKKKDGSYAMKPNGQPKVVVTDSVDTKGAGKAWRSDVRDAAFDHFGDPETGEFNPLDCAVEVELVFYRVRPKGHYGSGKHTKNVVKDSSPARPTTLPDVDKLSRAVLDALKGVAWTDDARITDKVVRKRYALAPRLDVKIFRADEQLASDLPIEERVPPQYRDLSEQPAPQQSLLAA